MGYPLSEVLHRRGQEAWAVGASDDGTEEPGTMLAAVYRKLIALVQSFQVMSTRELIPLRGVMV